MNMMKAILLLFLATGASAQEPAPYHHRADKIVNILRKEGAKPDREAIVMTLKAIDKNMKRYPKIGLSRHDWYAIAMAESRFNHRCKKGAAGDTGIFQVLGSVPDIERNTSDAFRVMWSKWKKFPNRREAIIAYNGYIRDKRTGRVRDRYYRYVMKQRERIKNV